MESDTPDASLSNILEGSGPPQSADYMTSSNSNRIINFSDAMTALRRHSFKNAPDFKEACQAARLLHRNTATTINLADISNLQAVRDQLHPIDDYLAYVSTLHASLAVTEPDSVLIPQLIAEFRKLAANIEPQLAQAVPIRWVGVCRHAARLAIETHNTLLALSLIHTLREAADKLSPAPDVLNPVQTDFLAVCLEAKCYKLAATWIRNNRRLQVDPKATALTGTDVHVFYHYSALTFIGVKDYRAAIQCCRLALAVPAPSPGYFFEVSTCTFKLYILLNLLVFGTVPPGLKFSSYQISRLRKNASEYMELAHAYERRDRKRVEQVFISSREYFEKQGHLGLVKQVLAALSKELIARLTNSFVTMKISDVAWRGGLPNETAAHAILIDMIRDGKINASIDDRKSIVRFMDNDVADENAIARNLSSGYMNDCVNIVQRVESFREEMESDPNYLMKEVTQAQHGRRGAHSALTAGQRLATVDDVLLR